MTATHSSTAPTERQLVERARNGDLRAWEMLVRRHQELVFRAGYLVTGDMERSEEVARVAFVRAYRALPDLAPDTLLRPWLLHVGMSVARARRREIDRDDRHARQPERLHGPRLAATPPHPGHATGTLTPPVREALIGAFDRLALDDRLVIASRYLFGLTRAEVAALIGLAPDIVDDRLRPAIEHLRTRLGDPRIASMPADQLGAWVVASVMSAATWTPDVAQAVMDRLQRDAIAYPEHFGPAAPASSPVSAVDPVSPGAGRTRSTGRPLWLRIPGLSTTIGLLAVAAIVIVLALVPGIGTPPWGREPATRGVDARAEGGPAVAQDPEGEVVQPAAAITGAAGARAGVSILRGGAVSARGDRVPVQIDWTAGIPAAEIGTLELQRKVATGTWATIASIDPAQPSVTSIVPGRRYLFRVGSTDAGRAIDPARRWRTWLALRDSTSPQLSVSRARTSRLEGAIGGSTLAVTDRATVSMTFHGRGVGLVAPLYPTPSSLRVRIDGGAWHSEPLEAGVTAVRRVVFSEQLEPGRHTLEIGAEQGTIALDAVLVLR